jgi:hypothetical protein
MGDRQHPEVVNEHLSTSWIASSGFKNCSQMLNAPAVIRRPTTTHLAGAFGGSVAACTLLRPKRTCLLQEPTHLLQEIR